MGTEVNSHSNIDTEFQLYKIRETLKQGGLEYHEDIDFLNFRFTLEKLKSDDENLCMTLIEFLKNMHSGTSIKFLMSEIIPKLSYLLNTVSDQYEKMLILYPKSTIILDLYISFLKNILNQTNKAIELLEKKNGLLTSNQVANLKSISYFDEDNGLIIISGATESFAIITYANATIEKILRQPAHTIVGNSISSYVPYPFNVGHNKNMHRFLISCCNAEIKLPLGLFLQTHIGFLVECFIQIRCTALDSFPFFLVLMKERVTTREIAIIDNEGIIINHSEKFPKILGENTHSLQNHHIDMYLEGLHFLQIEASDPNILNKNGKTIAVVKSFKIIKNKTVSIAYLIIDPFEIIS